jgi:hypothetical protein
MSFGVRAKPPPFIVPTPEPPRRPLVVPYLVATVGIVAGLLIAVGMGNVLWPLMGRKGASLAALVGPTMGAGVSMLVFGVPSLIIADLVLSLARVRSPLVYAAVGVLPIGAVLAVTELGLPGRQYDPVITALILLASMGLGGGVLGTLRRPRA